jgi:glycogen debranching enzyme
MVMQVHGDQQRQAERAHRTAVPSVAHEIEPADRLPIYRLPGNGLGMGASFGNEHCWITTKGRGAIDGFFSHDLGRSVVGAALVRYSGLGSRLLFSGEHQAPEDHNAFVQIRPREPGEVILHPAYQRHVFELPDELQVRQTIFVPKGTRRRTSHPHSGDLAVAYQVVELTNRAAETHPLRIYGFAQLRGDTYPDIQARYDAQRGALVAWNASKPNWVRVFGATAPVMAYDVTTDASLVYDLSHMYPLGNRTSDEGGHVLGALQVDMELEPGESRQLAFVVAFSPNGETEALADFDAARDAGRALKKTIAYYQTAVRPAEVLTPDPIINQGAVWAKINMIRVMADYPTGTAFTNDPSRSSAVVARDSFWFVYGSDHLCQPCSCALLEAFAKRQEPNGKIIEYYDAVTGETEDYGLNINDNTPLFILAVNHHWRASGHRDCLERWYPAVARAARHIISQMDERGLVFCTATGEGVHGIIGWRNICPHYRVSGAVTEVNAECAAALRAASHLAENLVGAPSAASAAANPGLITDACQFREAARRLTAAINRHLLNPENGLYYLTRDVDGLVRTDVTADEVFPVIFRVAPEDVAFRIVSRLNVPDFWTEAGLRTVSAESADYDPGGHWGLLGGVWPGVTWWYAFAASRYHPGGMVKALRASFEHYARAPKIHNTVPGQFSEWFDGESLVNRGMRLSPWEAPRFLWAAVEGICGIMVRPEPEPPMVEPLLPMEWKWVGLRNLTYHGRKFSYFAARLATPGSLLAVERTSPHPGEQDQALRCLQMYASGEMEVGEHCTVEQYTSDISDRVRVLNQELQVVALERPGQIVVCVGNVAPRTSVGALELRDVLTPGRRYHIHLYSSERMEWSHGPISEAAELARVALVVEAHGFRLLRLRAIE